LADDAATHKCGAQDCHVQGSEEFVKLHAERDHPVNFYGPDYGFPPAVKIEESEG